MRFVVSVLGVISAVMAIFGVVERVLLLFRLHGPFTATGEALMFLASFGRRRPRFTWQVGHRQGSLFRDSVGIVAAAALGIVFWLVVVVAVLCVLGPFKPVHEW